MHVLQKNSMVSLFESFFFVWHLSNSIGSDFNAFMCYLWLHIFEILFAYNIWICI